jgi:RNA polymerase sigma-70 factor, ECF subfamily
MVNKKLAADEKMLTTLALSRSKGRMSESDSLQVARVLRGEGDAYRTLVERHGRAVFRLAFRITGNEADAEDVVQETFLRAYRKLDSYDSRAAFSTWLHRIAANCAVDSVRHRSRRRESVVASLGDPDTEREILSELSSPEPGADRVVFSGQVRDRVDSAMGEMSPMERSAFVLRHFEGCSVDEISASLGLSSNAAKHCVFRAVQKLRRALQPLVSTS